MRERLMSLTELTAYVADQVPKKALSRAALQKRCLRGQVGQKVGNQWVVTLSEAQGIVEGLRDKGT